VRVAMEKSKAGKMYEGTANTMTTGRSLSAKNEAICVCLEAIKQAANVKYVDGQERKYF
jgi:hypothetical protein